MKFRALMMSALSFGLLACGKAPESSQPKTLEGSAPQTNRTENPLNIPGSKDYQINKFLIGYWVEVDGCKVVPEKRSLRKRFEARFFNFYRPESMGDDANLGEVLYQGSCTPTRHVDQEPNGGAFRVLNDVLEYRETRYAPFVRVEFIEVSENEMILNNHRMIRMSYDPRDR